LKIEFNKQFGRQVKTVSQDVQKAFMNYPWPGNIRELQHTIEHAFILCRTDVIELEHLPMEVLPENRPQLNPGTKNGVLQALEKTRWNITEAAKELNVSRQNLYRKMKYYKISRSRD
jgi:transcriptional regulator of acetoin/glycerol metabolism